MNEYIFTTSVSRNPTTFFTENNENLLDSQFPYDSIESIKEDEEENNSNDSILSLLVQINRVPTENTKNNSIDESRTPDIYFNVSNDKKTKRGRAAKNKNGKKEVHDNTKFDNLIRKIKVHFSKFIIDFSNSALKEEYKCCKVEFKYINNENKINVKSSYLSDLKKSTIKDLLKMDISTKCKAHKKSHNRDLLEKIESSSPFLSELFEMNYLELFRYYYNDKKPLKGIAYKNIDINLSGNEKCESFSYLLDKYKNLRKYLIDTAESEFLKRKEENKSNF